ncbi:MAG: hypothetical protein ABSB29_03850 [Nitrososphaerales archaeon]|jgi:hypothetical protein
MSVKAWTDGSIILDLRKGNIEQVIRKSFGEMRYVEAFALLHSWIDFLLWDIEPDEPLKFKTKFKGIRFKDSVDRNEERGSISPTEADRLRNFDDKRNVIVHRIVFNTLAMITPDEKFPALKITKRSIENSFDTTLRLAKILNAKRLSNHARPHNLRRIGASPTLD